MKNKIALAAASVVLLAGCNTMNPYDTSNTVKGTAGGAVGGAALGAAVAGSGKRNEGALVGRWWVLPSVAVWGIIWTSRKRICASSCRVLVLM